MIVARLIFVAFSLAAAVPAAAQDVNADANYGEVNLSHGFSDDPRVISLSSGGALDAARIGGSCAGFIADAPDVRLTYEAGSLPLVISVESQADTTLVVNAPDGRWYCDDDSGQGPLNPMVRFASPASGRYEIWVGTFRDSSLQPAQLNISELGSR